MRPLAPILRRAAALAALLATGAGAARAQAASWSRLVAEADSVGPEVPGVQVADSVEVSAGGQPYLLSFRSLRTRGMYAAAEPPRKGAGRFAVRQVLCDPQGGRPRAFVVERDHRWFYLRFNLRPDPSYDALRFFSGSARPLRYTWDRQRRTFQSDEECGGA